MITRDMWARMEKRQFDHAHNGKIGGVEKVASNRKQQAAEMRRQGKTYDEIAKALGIPGGAVSAYLKNTGLQRKYQQRPGTAQGER